MREPNEKKPLSSNINCEVALTKLALFLLHYHHQTLSSTGNTSHREQHIAEVHGREGDRSLRLEHAVGVQISHLSSATISQILPGYPHWEIIGSCSLNEK